MSGEKVEFEPLDKAGKKISMYVCGPTVYDRAHLGHGRSAVCFDVIRRYFEYKSYEVKFVSNYTDIDDKMINRAAEEGISVAELAERVIPQYVEDYGKLGVKPPTVQPRATEYIDEMIALIGKLEKKDATYVLDDGVYFDITKFPRYGKLSRQKLEELKIGARVEEKKDKRNPYDFVLWKFKKEGEPAWPSPWGEGRPGWHIECSAMSGKELGKTFDIHGGGLDLVFPHHECEVAQTQCVYGDKSFAHYWMHNGFINVNNEKMSKSLGNFQTLGAIFKKYDPAVVRLMFLQTHYRNPINFSEVLLEQAKGALERLRGFVRLVDVYYADLKNMRVLTQPKDTWGQKYLEHFEYYMDDDFNTSGALEAAFTLVSQINSLHTFATLTKADLDSAVDALKKMDFVFGVIFDEEEVLDAEVEALIAERERARTAKDFKRADKIRDELAAKGIVLEDTTGGVKWRKG